MERNLPKSTVKGCIQDGIKNKKIKYSPELVDLIGRCSVEFIRQIGSESNEVCEESKKKTILPEFVVEALKVVLIYSFIFFELIHNHFLKNLRKWDLIHMYLKLKKRFNNYKKRQQ